MMKLCTRTKVGRSAFASAQIHLTNRISHSIRSCSEPVLDYVLPSISQWKRCKYPCYRYPSTRCSQQHPIAQIAVGVSVPIIESSEQHTHSSAINIPRYPIICTQIPLHRRRRRQLRFPVRSATRRQTEHARASGEDEDGFGVYVEIDAVLRRQDSACW